MEGTEGLAREIAASLEAYLETLRRQWVATGAAVMGGSRVAAMECSVPGEMPLPPYVKPALTPHLQNLIRRVNEVIREQAYTEQFAMDPDWAFGRRVLQARSRTLSIRSVAFLGKTGSHSHRSALLQYPDADMHPVASFAEACRMVLAGEVDAAVLPIDNSTAGTIGDVYDLLLRHDLHIVRGASLSIRNVLLGIPGASVADVREVWTHPQPIVQCAGFIREKGLRAVAMESTAVAADAVSKAGDPAVAAIGSRDAAQMYGLTVLADDIDDAPTNQTRFVTVAREFVIPPLATRASLVFTLPHESGALSGVLSRLADFGLNVAKIQSRPIPHHAWEYSFHLDFESGADNVKALEALYMLDHELPYLKLLGWYPEQLGTMG